MSEPAPNSMGLVMYVTVYNREGVKILDTNYSSMLGEGESFKLPGYSFHLYADTVEYMKQATKLMKENVIRFQTEVLD